MDSEADARVAFVNRTSELSILQRLLDPDQMPGLLFLCGQAGIGKSRLTDELAARNEAGKIAFAIADPVLRATAGPASIYEGFFLQQCARALDALAQRFAYDGLDTLESFLKDRRWTAVRERKLGDALRKFPSWENLYGVAFDYIERLYAFGTFGREQLLNSDSREAIATCQAYVDAMVERVRLALVVRQAELIDSQSLKALLSFNRAATSNLLIFEYAADGFSFAADHEKMVLAELNLHPNARIFQLTQLETHHLELFLRQLNLPTQVVEWSTSARWDGNLRRLTQLQHMFMVRGDCIEGALPLALPGPEDFDTLVTEQVSALTGTQRTLLALAAVDPQPLERSVLLQVAQRILPTETVQRLNLALAYLLDEAGMLRTVNGAIAIAAAELLPAIDRATGFHAARIVAEGALRDFYVEAVESENAIVAPGAAMRRALTMVARSEDPQLLLSLLDTCSARIAKVNDQGLYVDLVAEAIAADDHLLPSERSRLTRWAADLAYDICDFRTCRKLLENSNDMGVEATVLLASCVIECGDHATARELLAGIDRSASLALTLAADVLEGSIALDAGAWDLARFQLRRVASDGRVLAPAIAGHALRLLPELLPYPECTKQAIKSVTMFESAGLSRAAAYSAMSASRFLAREGKIAKARTMLARCDELRDSVRDAHMILNNRALIDLLDAEPDFASAVAALQLALRTSRDDFSDLSILCNLAIAQAGAGAIESALDCVARGGLILDAPEFAERDVYWPVCFNFAWVLDQAGQADEAAAMRKRPGQQGWRHRSNDPYWAWRFGETADNQDTELAYLHRFAYHPVALSHWQLDREVVATLSGSPRQ